MTQILHPIGSTIKVRADGVVIDGIVTGHSEKDGKPIIDYFGKCMLSNGKLSQPTTRWAWLAQLIGTNDGDDIQDVVPAVLECSVK